MTSKAEIYYTAVDSGDAAAAVALLADDVQFAMIIPTGVNRGRGRADMYSYLSARPDVGRKHVVLRTATDRDMVFVHGVVTENGDSTGAFVGAMHIDDAGLIDRYQVAFDSTFSVLPSAAQD
ncbi:nuclear transport factor 2 family protein [Rhodococcus fascians]|nr:nuclear transport factor 2 family protein [Rhodococcus fascians]MBY4237854.1 nuclear transport factor 2 family protein [Rhodococcus fascians]MBY4253395.1 nuclear transport factor 2 family protein [Rhodococcus fascians]MBY4269032.1 nuclear transport factor 2 family protein [Rhodococcus fascians]MBY4275085.1 nuclear transport factor 2 family protein [Rhodococcus fascians]